MVQADRRAHLAVSDLLRERTWQFDFFQAVRMLEWMAWEAQSQGQPPRAPVGEDARPDRELVRFRVPPTTGFAASAVGTLVEPRPVPGEPAGPIELSVSFLGLIGASGVLPLHYSAEALSRSQNQDRALQEFFDIFQHRAVSLFYRAWRKYRLPFELERSLRQPSEPGRDARSDDPFSFVLRCLVGLGTAGLAGRLQVADETAVYYAGHFTHAARSALALERMLGDFFNLAAQVQQFSGRWLTLPPDQRTAMPTQVRPRGAYCSLGRDSVVGSRVWDVQSRFRIRLGPMSYRQFLEFLPGQEAMRKLRDLVRLYVGPALEFEVQPVLRRDEVPTAQLAAKPKPGEIPATTMLTRNAWLATGRRDRDAEEAVFQA